MIIFVQNVSYIAKTEQESQPHLFSPRLQLFQLVLVPRAEQRWSQTPRNILPRSVPPRTLQPPVSSCPRQLAARMCYWLLPGHYGNCWRRSVTAAAAVVAVPGTTPPQLLCQGCD